MSLPNVPYRQKTFLFNRQTQHAAPGRGAERRWPDGRNPGGQHAPAAPEAIRTRSGTHPSLMRCDGFIKKPEGE